MDVDDKQLLVFKWEEEKMVLEHPKCDSSALISRGRFDSGHGERFGDRRGLHSGLWR